MINNKEDLIKIFLVPAGVVLGLIFMYGLIINPQLAVIKANFGKISELQKQTKLIRDKVDYLSTVPQAEIKKNSELLANAVLVQKDAYFLVDVVRKIADRYGFEVESFLVSPGKISGAEDKNVKVISGVEQLSLTVTLFGPKDQYLEVIKAIENSLPIMAIRKFEMKNSLANSEMSMVIAAFYIKDDDSKITNLSLVDLKLSDTELKLFKEIEKFDNNGAIVRATTQSPVSTNSGVLRYGRENPFIP